MALDPTLNFSKGTLSTGYDDAAVEVVLESGHGAKFPQPSTDGSFNVVWYNSTDYADPSDDPNVEIVRVTARTTDTLTILRAQESTTAKTHNTANKTYKMILGPTAKTITDINSEKANISLNNLASVAINTTLVSDTDNTDALGTASIGWSDLFLGNGAVITWSSAPSTADMTLTHVAGSLQASGGNFYIGRGGISETNNPMLFIMGGTGAADTGRSGVFQVDATNRNLNIGSYNGLAFYVNGTSGAAPSTGTLAMGMDGAGNVGIGTTAPDRLLHISKAGGAEMEFTNSTNGKSWHYGAYGTGFTLTETGSATRLALLSGGDIGIGGSIDYTTLAGAAIVAKSSGNVGIGTTSPSHKLDVVQTGTTTGLAAIKGLNSGINVGTAYGVYGTATGASQTNVGGYFSATGGVVNNYGLIVESGNVGIGTTGPAYPLDVVGSMRVSGNYYGNYFSNPSGARYSKMYLGGTINGSTNSIELATDGVDRLVIDSTGNVGIGTTAPGANLDVYDSGATSNATIFNIGAADSTGHWNITNGGTTTSRRILHGFNGAIESIRLDPGVNVSYINAGNVGIGTTEPHYPLEVAGVISSAYGDASAVNGTLRLGNETVTGGAQYATIAYSSVADNNLTFTTAYAAGTNNYMAFAPGGTERVRFQQNGNVGIGTTSPTSKLHLAAGTATAGTAPLGFTSGTLLTVPVVGKVEFLDDAWYGTITTGAARKTFAFLDSITVTTGNGVSATNTAGALAFTLGAITPTTISSTGLHQITISDATVYSASGYRNSFLQVYNNSATDNSFSNIVLTVLRADATGGGVVINAIASGSYSADLAIQTRNAGNYQESFRVAYNGIVTIPALSGTGSRAVLADANGLLSAPVSDERLKKNITPINSRVAMKMLEDPKIQAVQFNWKDKSKGNDTELGFLYQAFEKYDIKGLTFFDNGFGGINYEKISTLLWTQNVEQQKQIESLTKRIEALEKQWKQKN